jgi:hypothetical protein
VRVRRGKEEEEEETREAREWIDPERRARERAMMMVFLLEQQHLARRPEHIVQFRPMSITTPLGLHSALVRSTRSRTLGGFCVAVR